MNVNGLYFAVTITFEQGLLAAFDAASLQCDTRTAEGVISSGDTLLLCDISTSGSVSLFVASQDTSISSVYEVGLSSPEAGRLRRVAAQKRLSVSSVPRRHLRPSQDAPAVCCREKSWLNEVGPRAGLSSRRATYREGHRLRGPTSGPSRDPVLEPLLQRPTTLTRQGY